MKKLQKGFTLIELMIVVAIIAILAAVAAPKFGNQLKKAKDAKGIEIVGNYRSALTMYYADNQTYPTKMADMKDSVDTKTQDSTYANNATIAKFAFATSTASDAAVQVGTGNIAGSDSKAYQSFSITGSTTESSIIFGSGSDTKGTTWSAY
jgi:type IV pilus assembly protein PilA